MSEKKPTPKETRDRYYALVRKAAEHVKAMQDLMHQAHDEVMAANAAIFDAEELDPQPDGRHDWLGERMAVTCYRQDVQNGMMAICNAMGKLPDAIMTEALLELGIETSTPVMNGVYVEEIRTTTPIGQFALMRASERRAAQQSA